MGASFFLAFQRNQTSKAQKALLPKQAVVRRYIKISDKINICFFDGQNRNANGGMASLEYLNLLAISFWINTSQRLDLSKADPQALSASTHHMTSFNICTSQPRDFFESLCSGVHRKQRSLCFVMKTQKKPWNMAVEMGSSQWLKRKKGLHPLNNLLITRITSLSELLRSMYVTTYK